MSAINQWHILVVEDEPDGREVIAAILGYYNVTVDVASHAEEALKLLAENQYTAAVIDLALPGMDGIRLINEIRNNPTTAHLPCVAITAFHSSQVRREALQAGFDGYFPKPLDDTSFVRGLDSVITEER
ncbi:MAG: response regulator [Chloroflexi bacterium]|nr:MAG: response regulator [Chloroflexota bacterium]